MLMALSVGLAFAVGLALGLVVAVFVWWFWVQTPSIVTTQSETSDIQMVREEPKAASMPLVPYMNPARGAAFNTHRGMQVYGLDFTSAPSHKKPLTCAVCTFNEDVLCLEELRPLDSFPGFEALLASQGPWVMGLDFPFGQPRKLIENLGWPQSWEGYVGHVETMGKQSFEDVLRDYVQGRKPGDKHHLRAVDRPAGAQSPMKLDYIPVRKRYSSVKCRCFISFYLILPGNEIGAWLPLPARPFPGTRLRPFSDHDYEYDRRIAQRPNCFFSVCKNGGIEFRM